MRPMKSHKFLVLMLFAFLLTCASLPTQAQTYTVLHTFHGAPSDGDEPMSTLLRDAAGNLYGTTGTGGLGNCPPFAGCGTVFALSKSGQELGVFSFNGQNGDAPYGGVFRDPAGNFYGTTTLGGGSQNCGSGGCGTIFQLNRTGSKIRYYSFDQTDGWSPESTPVAVSGSLYGTTYWGGTGGVGTIFKINARGKETVVHSFNISDGCYPGGLAADKKGNLYGVTFSGGGTESCSDGGGTAYELDTTGNFTVLYDFPGAIGGNASSALIIDSEGNLYGASETGGLGQDCTGACGSVFELSPGNNGTWSGRALYSFCSLPNCADGDRPRGSVVLDASGNIYGTTIFGGAYGDGVVFKLDTSGNETVLHNFTGGSDGAAPSGGLIMDAAGNLYGTAQLGGDTTCDASHGGCGVVFELTP